MCVTIGTVLSPCCELNHSGVKKADSESSEKQQFPAWSSRVRGVNRIP